MPHELALVGIYFSPLLPIVLFGILGALATAFVLNRTGLSGWFANPPWVFMALIDQGRAGRAGSRAAGTASRQAQGWKAKAPSSKAGARLP